MKNVFIISQHKTHTEYHLCHSMIVVNKIELRNLALNNLEFT